MSYTGMKCALSRVQSKVLTDLNDANSNAYDHSKTRPPPGPARKNDAQRNFPPFDSACSVTKPCDLSQLVRF